MPYFNYLKLLFLFGLVLFAKPMFAEELKAIADIIVREGVTPLKVTLDASKSEGDIENYIWQASDGQIAHGKLTHMLFSQPGTYSIALTVISKEGKSDIAPVRVIKVKSSDNGEGKPLGSALTLTFLKDEYKPNDAFKVDLTVKFQNALENCGQSASLWVAVKVPDVLSAQPLFFAQGSDPSIPIFIVEPQAYVTSLNRNDEPMTYSLLDFPEGVIGDLPRGEYLFYVALVQVGETPFNPMASCIDSYGRTLSVLKRVRIEDW